jgi:alginate production protein
MRCLIIVLLLLQSFLGSFAYARDDYTGKTFRVTGTWNGAQLEAARIQLREAEQEAGRAQLSGAIESLDAAGRSLRIGPLSIDWNDKTEFKGLALKDLKIGTLVRATGRRVGPGRWLASSIQPSSERVWPKGQLQLNGVAAASGGIGAASQLDIGGVPVRLREAGYNRVESLTQRQDTRRPDQPFSVELGGRPLIITGDYTTTYRERKNFKLDDNTRSNVDQEVKVELFYPYRRDLSFFAEAKAFYEHELRRTDGEDRTSEGGVKRGQSWVFFDGLAQRRIGVQLGRQNFKETREWWWDDDLDAARVYFDDGPLHAELGVGRELARESTNDDGIDPAQKNVNRLIGQASWLWTSRQAIELYALHQDDRSKREAVGSTVREGAEDDSDARLTWLGLRAIGQRSTDAAGNFKYWADVGVVRGRETTYEFDDPAGGRSRIDVRSTRDVRGHAFDIGLSWQTPLKLKPALSIGYAQGSGDDGRGDTDRSFRQTGLHNNKARFFGVNRFRYYGELQRPELSNLSVSTLALGVPFFNRSSVELVHHRYRQVKAADFMRAISVDADLTGASRDIGAEFDVIFGFRDAARWDFAVIASRFKAGDAYGLRAGELAYLWLFEATYNF